MLNRKFVYYTLCCSISFYFLLLNILFLQKKRRRKKSSVEGCFEVNLALLSSPLTYSLLALQKNPLSFHISFYKKIYIYDTCTCLCFSFIFEYILDIYRITMTKFSYAFAFFSLTAERVDCEKLSSSDIFSTP